MSKLGFPFGIFFSTCFDYCGREPSAPESGKAAEKKASSLMDSVMKQIVPTPAASLESSIRFLDDHEVPVESLLKGGPRKWQSKGMESEETCSVSTTHSPYFNLLYHFLRFHPFIFVSAT